MVLGKLPVPGRPTTWIRVGQGPTALAVGAGGGCLDIFTLLYPFSPLFPSLWETARYRLKYCLKGPLNPKQPTNQKSISCYSKHISYIILACSSNIWKSHGCVCNMSCLSIYLIRSFSLLNCPFCCFAYW